MKPTGLNLKVNCEINTVRFTESDEPREMYDGLMLLCATCFQLFSSLTIPISVMQVSVDSVRASMEGLQYKLRNDFM